MGNKSMLTTIKNLLGFGAKEQQNKEPSIPELIAMIERGNPSVLLDIYCARALRWEPTEEDRATRPYEGRYAFPQYTATEAARSETIASLKRMLESVQVTTAD